jgi:hypothetical protein
MSNVEEVMKIEALLREAELGPDPAFFEAALDDDVLLDGARAKANVVEAHRPGKGQKFSRVEMDDFETIDHGAAVVVTCRGEYTNDRETFSLRFMRVWVKKEGRWKIVAGSVLK